MLRTRNTIIHWYLKMISKVSCCWRCLRFWSRLICWGTLWAARTSSGPAGTQRVAACLVLTQKQKPEQLQKDPKQGRLPCLSPSLLTTNNSWLIGWLGVRGEEAQSPLARCQSTVYSKICPGCLSVLSVNLIWLLSESMKIFRVHIHRLMVQCLLWNWLDWLSCYLITGG